MMPIRRQLGKRDTVNLFSAASRLPELWDLMGRLMER